MAQQKSLAPYLNMPMQNLMTMVIFHHKNNQCLFQSRCGTPHGPLILVDGYPAGLINLNSVTMWQAPYWSIQATRSHLGRQTAFFNLVTQYCLGHGTTTDITGTHNHQQWVLGGWLNWRVRGQQSLHCVMISQR